MLPAHFMVTGNFSLRTLRMSSAVRRNASPVRRLQLSAPPEKMIHVLVPFEDALAVVRTRHSALAKTRTCRPSIKAHAGDALGDGVAVSAGIAVDRRAHRAGNARQRLQALQSARRW